MVSESGVQMVHRPGLLKQVNKAHKHGRHRSKGSISSMNKGRQELKSISTRHAKRELNREQRRNQAKQIRCNKRDESLQRKRNIGGAVGAPLCVVLVPLKVDQDCGTALNLLRQCDGDAISALSARGVCHIWSSRLKQRFEVLQMRPCFGDSPFQLLDALKVCDCAVFVVSACMGFDQDDQLLDAWAEGVLTASMAQGLPPSVVVAVTDLDSIAPKKRHNTKQAIQRAMNKWLPDEKVQVLASDCDGLNLLRRIGSQKRKTIHYRDHRPYLMAEDVQLCSEPSNGRQVLKISGYLRGTPLSVNGLVHIPSVGDFQMLQIDAPQDPFGLQSRFSDSTTVLAVADPNLQESLVAVQELNPLQGEQTWPTEDDYEMAAAEQELPKTKRIPKGWSDYQAAWIPDDDPDFFSDSDEEDAESIMDNNAEDNFIKPYQEEDEDGGQRNNEQHEETSSIMMDTESVVDNDQKQYDAQVDMKKEREALVRFKLEDARSHELFPDEIDTPMELPARQRLQKYRGLESFRTSPWDPKENLPLDYGRIFQFENFNRTRKRVSKQQKEDAERATSVASGQYVTIHLKIHDDVVLNERTLAARVPLTLFGLYPHEHKMSVMNVVLKRISVKEHFEQEPEPIKAKETLIFQCGFRRFAANPIFSEHTNGNKFKMERYFQPGRAVVASFFAPIMFPPCPVLCYKESISGLGLVAAGNLMSCDPDRIVLKRVVLSGHPFKIFKKSAIIRFMFFNREDILYFKPCKLRTKWGQNGHIKEPLGTHGHFKAVFDGQLKSEDTVLLHLYKRVFPKWRPYSDYSNNDNSSEMAMLDDEHRAA